MKRVLLCLALSVASAAQAGPPPTAQLDPVFGTWRNPKGTIEVRTDRCGQMLCGVIVGATPKAMNDAKKGGVTSLIGTQLLQDYHAAGRGKWSGRVFIPDMGRSFSSKMVQTSPNQIQISGCILGGLICKTQVWTRTDQ